MATTYTISDLAREFDLTTRAIRFYEDMGLLQPERSGPGGRNRVYSHRDRTRLDPARRVARKPPRELPPEGAERQVIHRNLGAHLPEPVVLNGERHGEAATEVLVGEHRL